MSDASESLTNINWTVYRKIASITKGGAVIRYVYDASGNRIFKYTATDTTAYVRDASGNVLSVYTRTTSTSLQQTETHLYGSSRLGLATQHLQPDTSLSLSGGFVSGIKTIFLRGEKIFELSNHLGNVLVTLSDRRVQHSAGGTTVDYYRADVASANDYYPFGMMMPGRKYSSSASHRYGFNGKENDNEVKGEGNQQDYGMRIYDPRISRFLSVDPLAPTFPWFTPYQFAGNRPIIAIDLDGLEPHDVNTKQKKADLPTTAATGLSADDPVAYGKKIQPWKDLLNFKVSDVLLKGMKNRGVGGGVQHITNASSSKTNFDYYAIKIDKLPSSVKNAGELLDKLRLNLGDFLDDKTTFGGYNAAERSKWNSAEPLGSVLSFDAYFNFIGVADLNLDDASVITSSYSREEDGGFWTFSTLHTGGDGSHPIAGNRQFGVSSSVDGSGVTSYLFYIRAVDRGYGVAGTLFQNKVFDSAHETWTTVCKNVADYVNKNGGSAIIQTPITKRVSWNEVQKLNN